MIPAPAPRPIWKRWWLWAAVAVVVLVIASAVGADTPSTTSSSSQAPTSLPAPPVTTTPAPPKRVHVPRLVGVRAAKASALARGAGFVVRLDHAFSTKPPGTVLSVRPRANRLDQGTSITLIVAKPVPKIPNVVGDHLASARRTLKDRGFDVRVRKQTSSQPKNTVISESPQAGTPARQGRLVTIVVAKAPPSTGTGGGGCTPGYSPCIPPGPDVDCAGGGGDGPRYVSGPIRVTGSDPYGLDSDGDGYGCE